MVHDIMPDRRENGSSRRSFIKAAGGAGSATALAGCLTSLTGGGGTTINVLAWASFENVRDNIANFVDAEIELSTVTSTEPMFTQWNSGQNDEFDVTMPNNNYMPKFIDAGLVAPLNEDVVTNWDNIYPRYQELAQSQAGRDGTVYGVPQRFGWDTYAYDTREVPDHEEDLEMMFNDEYQGRIGSFQQFTKAMGHAALYLGYQDAFEGRQITLSQEQIDEVTSVLKEQSDLVSAYYAAPSQIKELFSGGSVSVGHSYRFVSAQMKMEGNDWMQMAVPQQGALTWFETAVVSSESQNKEKAWEVVNAILEPEVVGEWLAGSGFASTNANLVDELEGDTGQYIDIEPSRVENMIPYKEISNEDAWVSAWEEVRTS
ncbi:ABC transporter substrate-binding protein [Haloarchaeobius salinus]|uniref:ABC transporter substrate-binding protein n=1 Tax=Haloarchaeobius salinus TaxID=1198298 RepID=UPI00210AAE4D|nr:extracellular solute-binding protein [Haloarchaeobius salinus]